MNKLKALPAHPGTFFLLLLIFPLMAACGGGETKPSPTPTLSPLQVELEDAISQFEAQGLNSYTVRVTYRKGGWAPQILDLAVVDGEAMLLNQNCIPERTCGLRPVDEADFTLASIFIVVREQAAVNGVSQVTYHDTYGFPRIINTAEGAYEISNFQPTE